MKPGFEKSSRCVWLGAIQGGTAWSAYAVGEFLCASVLFHLVRPYATFTSLHWRLTVLLIVGYLVTGMVAGALAGLGVALLKRRTRWIAGSDAGALLETAATLTVAIAFLGSLLTASPSHTGWIVLSITSAALIALLLTALRSQAWSERVGFLTHPWIVASLLLGAGLAMSLLDLDTLARQLGVSVRVWQILAAAGLLTVALASVLLGRPGARWARSKLPRDRFLMTAPGWAAAALALLIIAIGAWRGQERPASIPARRESPAAAIAPSARPNVLMIVMDTVRADHLSVYGYERDTTPNLKKLARDAALYTDAISAADITLSSHASMFTGLYPSWHGARCRPPEAAFGAPVAKEIPTLAEILEGKGYNTLGVAANLYLRADFGLQRGFHSFRIPRPVPILTDEGWYMLRRKMRSALSLFADTAQFDRLFSRGEDVNRELFAQDIGRSGVPFFVFLNYMDAHFPYIPPAPFDREFPGKNDRVTQEDLQEVQYRVVAGTRPWPEDLYRHTMAQYDGGIAYIDAQIGQVMEWLKQRNLYDNTLIVIASDHGEAFGEKNLALHGNSVYQNLLHVALLVKFPHSAHQGVYHDPVSLVDVMPTILSVAGYEAPGNGQGRNLLDAVQSAGPSREIYSESFPCPVMHSSDCPSGCTMRAVFAWPNKFITSSSGRYQYYDLSSDPDENHDLSVAQRSDAANLGLKLGHWVRTMPAQSRQQTPLDREALQRLKALGYVQ